MKAGIYILNYNGKELLEICLPSICEAASKSRRQCRIVVVDNLSTDGSREFVAENFPSVEFRGMKENRVLCSFNDAVRDSDEDIVLLMNNDLKVDPGFLDPLLRVFEEKDDAFAAIPCCMSFDGKRIEVSKTLPVFEWGLLKGVPAPDGERIKTLTYTLQGGFGAFSRKRFREIGGYDDLYLPGIIDDTDLCVRAWKKGYACYYQPGSVICHMGRASFKKAFGLRRLLAISHRNTYLFAWKHIDSWKDFLKHVFFIPVRLVYSLIALKPEIVWGFFWAVKLMPEALARRKKEKDADHELGMKDVLDKITGREWSDFYKDSKSHEEISENLRNHRKFLDEVIKGGPKKIIEIGCGSGTMAAFLSSKVEHVVSVDNDPGVLDAARRNCEKTQG
ncbi:MAG: glycosyltransferase, partial [Candidatus Omnitrophota bacterium]